MNNNKIVALVLMVLLINQLSGANIDVGALLKSPIAAKKKVKSIAVETDSES